MKFLKAGATLSAVVFGAAALGASALASGTAPSENVEPVLSSTQIQAILDGRAIPGGLPPNCYVEYFPGTNICTGIICIEDGALVLYECNSIGIGNGL